MVDLKVECAASGYHSGEVGGIVPETFRIVRELLDRIDDPKTGKVVDAFQSELPDWKVKEAIEVVRSQQTVLYDKFPVHEGVQVMNQDNLVEMYLDNVWRPNLAITGAGGLPNFKKAGNVIRASTTVRVSLRISPLMVSETAKEKLIEILTTDVPYNAKVTILGSNGGDGYCQKVLEPWLQGAIEKAGQDFYDKPAGTFGDGGSIPFLNELAKKYPDSQIVAFGVLGPYSNAHGPNEFLELDYAKKLTCSLSAILGVCGQR